MTKECLPFIVDNIEEPSSSTELSDLLQQKGIYYITSAIQQDSLLSIQQDILLKHIEGNWKGPIQLFINSPGGIAPETWCLVDFLEYINFEIWTTGMGQVCSAGASLLACGTKGKRRVMPNTTIMIHQFSAMSEGNYSQLVAEMTQFRMEQDRDIKFWLEHSNLKTEKEVLEKILKPTDTYLSPEQALELGIIDEVITKKQIKKGKQHRTK